MDADILVQLLINAGIPAEQFQLHGLEVYFIDPDANNKPVDAPYDTPENRAIVEDVIKNYDTLAAEYMAKENIKKQIVDLEVQQQTLRRMREALAGVDNGWLLKLNIQIEELRAQLK